MYKTTKMKKALLLIFLTIALQVQTQAQTEYVNPFIGTGGHGHTFPGATVPFGMVQLSPDTRLTGWDGCSGYHYTDKVVYGFSHTHLSGTGVSDYGDILLMPTTGKTVFNNGADEKAGYRSPFSKENEKAEAGYYTTYLDKYDIAVELTATERAGFHKYTFPKNDKGNILIDLEHRDKVINSGITKVSDTEIEGFRLSKAWAEEQHVYFVIQFSQPFQKMEVETEGKAEVVAGENIKANLEFDLKNNKEILVRVGISSVSIEGARKNLEKEINHWDFEKTKKTTQEKWTKALSKIDIEGGTDDQKTVFYTALYHTMIAPNLFMDVDGKYRGTDLKIHQAKDYTHYTIFSLWDTYRATHPLYTLIEQKRTNDFIKTFIAQYETGGQLPVWELSGNYTGCMIGYHAVPVIADAYLKGIRDYDENKAFEAMIHSAEQDKLGLEGYKKYGFIPAESEAESVSKTLEYAYDDWCIAQMAAAINEEEDLYKRYLQRAQYYKNIYDSSTGFMRGRMDNAWVVPFEPAEVNYHYTEANAWQYSMYVPQDITGLMNIMGGKEKLEKKLDDLFTANSETSGRHQVDITGLIGQYAHGNEPSHHMAYLYNYLNKPHKTQEKIRQIMDELYFNAPDGLSGNEDCGQMSAWYVLSAIGFYPVTPGSEDYIIGSPLFEKVTLHLENGNDFVIEAKNNNPQNKYIQSAQLNNTPHEKSYITHSDLMKGGNLTFTMTNNPKNEWATNDKNIPTSTINKHLIVTTPIITKGKKAFYEENEIELNTLTKDAEIYYTLDGTNPTTKSQKYTKPFTIKDDCTLKTFAKKEGVGESATIETNFVRIRKHRTIKHNTAYGKQYAAGGNNALVDALRGGKDYRTGTWQGFEGVDINAIIDLGKKEAITKLTIGFLQDENSWIFMPETVTFYTSNDGKNFKEIGSIQNNISPKEKGTQLKDFTLPTNTQAQYLKVIAKNRGICPEYHKGAGGKSWIFADEIIIK